MVCIHLRFYHCDKHRIIGPIIDENTHNAVNEVHRSDAGQTIDPAAVDPANQGVYIHRFPVLVPHTWSRFSFGAWLRTASERLHRHKLAIALANKLARIAWSVLRHDKAFDTHLEIAAI